MVEFSEFVQTYANPQNYKLMIQGVQEENGRTSWVDSL